MAVLKNIRARLFPFAADAARGEASPVNMSTAFHAASVPDSFPAVSYDVRPLTAAQMEEVFRLDQRCFMDGEAYSRETFDYLLNEPAAVCFRAVTATDGAMAGFVIGIMEEAATGHITTVGVAPEHRRRHLAQRLLERAEEMFRKRGATTMRLEVRAVNTGAQKLYLRAGYSITQRLVKYYSNGGDGLLMVKSLD